MSAARLLDRAAVMSRSRRVFLLSAGALAVGSGALASPPAPAPFRAEVFPLGPGRGIERELVSGTVHVYRFPLEAGQYLHFAVEQRGADVMVRLLDPAGEQLQEVDSTNGNQGPEDLFWIAERPGSYRAELRLWPGLSGRYKARIAALRWPSLEDRRRVAAARAFDRARRMRGRRELREAASNFEEAAAEWGRSGDPTRRVEALRQGAAVLADAGDFQAALDTSQEMLSLALRLGDRRNQAFALSEIASAREMLGEPGSAKVFYEQSLAIWNELGDLIGRAPTLNNLGRWHYRAGEMQRALELYEQARRDGEQLGDATGQAFALRGIGAVYVALREPAIASAYLQNALKLLAADHRHKAETLALIANAHATAGETRRALLLLSVASVLQRRAGDQAGRAVTLTSLGKLHYQLREHATALDLHRAALSLFQRVGDRASEATVWNNLGWIYSERGQIREAIECYRRAMFLARAVGDRDLEAASLYGTARSERQRGSPITARARIEAAIGIIESLRGGITVHDLQLSFFPKWKGYYDFLVDLLMEEHRRRPAGGYDALALGVSERARARNLLDVIAGTHTPAVPLSLPEIQREIRDRNTVVLEYHLAEPRSFLWVIDGKSMASFELPGQARLEAEARQVHRLVSRSRELISREAAQLRLRHLGSRLLGPVADRLGTRRLLIIPHEALLYVPFGALPEPPGMDPLLLRHEVVVLPSVSALDALQRRSVGRAPPQGLLALLADAVFQPDDPRLQGEARRRAAASLTEPLPGGELPRLWFAGHEAAAILSLVPAERALPATGFKASRELVLSGQLARFRILHFATHALVDEQHPEQSGLVLSRFDAAGHPVEGLLQPTTIEKLRFPADLVVLSACQTALGRPVRGEGLLGLTRSFLTAGADRVLVSLWKVDDRATAALMERFYQALFRKRLSPPAALREAQLSMWREKRWEDPYYWSGFMLQGDWRDFRR